MINGLNVAKPNKNGMTFLIYLQYIILVILIYMFLKEKNTNLNNTFNKCEIFKGILIKNQEIVFN